MSELQHAIRLASRLLDEPSADPDDDLRTLSRQMLRWIEIAEKAQAELAARDATIAAQAGEIERLRADVKRLAALSDDNIAQFNSAFDEANRIATDFNAMRIRAEKAEAALAAKDAEIERLKIACTIDYASELDAARIEGWNAGVEAARTERCHGARDGECMWERCPQLRDNEPYKSGRHCPLDTGDDYS